MVGCRPGPPPTPSRPMRAVMMTIALLHILLSSGEAYGWTALRPVLLRSGFFGAFDEAARTRKLNLVSTLGISANAMCKLPLGFILDRAGPRATALLGSIFFVVGTLMMGWGDKQSVGQMAFAYFLLGTSGPFLQMPAFQFSNLFPSMKATLISLMITAFELSTGVFYLFNVANVQLHLDHTELFTIYSCVGVFTFFTSLFLWPDSPHVEPSNAPGDVEPARVDKPATEGATESALEDEAQPVVVGGRVPLIEQTFWRQVFSWEFAYVTLFFAVHNFTQGVVLTTTGMQVSHYFPDEGTAEMMADMFSIILPMGFLPVLFCTVTGVSGFILNRPQLAFLVVSLMSCTYGAMFLFPYIPCYLFLFAIFPVARQFVFSTFISYSASTFGYKSFGVLNGLASTIAGLVQLLQNVLVAMVVSDSIAFTWEEMDVLMSLVPTILLIPPSIHFLRQLCSKRSQSGLADPLLGESSDFYDPNSSHAPVAIPGMPRSHSIASITGTSHYGSLTVPAAGIPNFGSLSLSYGPKPFMLVGSFTSTADQDEHFLRSPPNGRASTVQYRGGGNS